MYKYDSKIHIPLDSEFKALVKKHADNNFMTVADYTRQALRTQIKQEINMTQDQEVE